MPTLIIARHAKAEAPAPGLDDIDRTLALIGRKASTNLGEQLAAAGRVPDLALVSSATRTQQTWKLMSAAFAGVESRIVDDLYETDVEGMLDQVRVLEGVETVVLVGHEPTSSHAAAFLAGPGSDKSSLQSIAQGLSTGTAAVLEFDGAWSDLSSREARLVAVLSGRDVS